MTDTTYEGTCKTTKTSKPPLPAYMTEVYDWAYVNPRWVRWLDRNIVVKTLLFGNDQRLIRAYLSRIQPGMRVWQLAHVYGDLVRRAAECVGPAGEFTLTDVTPIQIAHGHAKLRNMDWAHTHHADAGLYRVDKDYDLICSFFLLHEVPDDCKHRIIDNMLNQLPENGEALFIDYHRPALWQPIRYILSWVNHALEPFANALWKREISSFASHPERFTWRKQTIFGGVYQIVSVRHALSKPDPDADSGL
ncbi:rhodoquinone biosynthesis methyltransferase RquA [Uliginosibacterium sp. H3]|uniref:Rhodoquinone biosynthesis methyltransferase RquA n=1 Tax=Uliginosibacterium silvisoli TaxID=3114758 RepID=A0ABU6JYZ9_9RHOO|nr:rhodoquinone biosynthesis methyltransferase RquA [Uliginosibacterium sp. H3]